jgi:integrase
VRRELRALRRLNREQKPKSPFVFTSERGSPFTTAGFARLVERAGAAAKLGFKAHPHMLRHACGFALAKRAMIRGLFSAPHQLVPAAATVKAAATNEQHDQNDDDEGGGVHDRSSALRSAFECKGRA